jgi:hypothetical protein
LKFKLYKITLLNLNFAVEITFAWLPRLKRDVKLIFNNILKYPRVSIKPIFNNDIIVLVFYREITCNGKKLTKVGKRKHKIKIEKILQNKDSKLLEFIRAINIEKQQV